MNGALRTTMVSIHAPLGGAERRESLRRAASSTPVSIHAPLGGAERHGQRIGSRSLRGFNPRSARWSGATGFAATAYVLTKFQSTLRSVERSDSPSLSFAAFALCFNPRSARWSGATDRSACSAGHISFQSTLRSVERSDAMPCRLCPNQTRFQSTLRSVERSDLSRDQAWVITLWFQSTLRSVERSDDRRFGGGSEARSFNPRSARWSGATVAVVGIEDVGGVSIHAPLGGAERRCWRGWRSRTPGFNPRSARWSGATGSRRGQGAVVRSFNPRSARWSGATGQGPRRDRPLLFQSTLRSVERSDPHQPEVLKALRVSIHAPLGGAERR